MATVAMSSGDDAGLGICGLGTCDLGIGLHIDNKGARAWVVPDGEPRAPGTELVTGLVHTSVDTLHQALLVGPGLVRVLAPHREGLP